MSKKDININEDNSGFSEEYKKGYAEAIEEIRKSLGGGGGGGGGGPQGPPPSLPDPRLKRPPQSNQSKQKQSGQGGKGNGQDGQNGQKGQHGENQKKGKKKIDKKSAAKAAQDTADAAKQKAKELAEKAAATGDQKDKEAAEKAKQEAEAAQKAADEAKKNAQNNDNDESGEGDPDSWSGGDMDYDVDPDQIDGDIWDCTEGVNGVLNDYKNKLTGAVGEFMETIRGSHEDLSKLEEKKKRGALTSYARKAAEAWDVQLNEILNVYITEEIEEYKREYIQTYRRHNRRQGVVRPDEIIKKGKMPKKDKINISMTFYIDKSGSMGSGKLNNAFKASRAFATCIKDNNSEEIIIDDFDYTYYAFDTHFHEVKGNQVPSASGSNVDFDKILSYIHENSLNDMVNIIITDAQFPINPKGCIEAIKKTTGLFIVVANSSYNQADFEDIEKALPGKFKFLLADDDFTVHASKIK